MRVAQARKRAINSLRPRSILSRAYGENDTDGPVAFWDARSHDGGPLLKDLSGNGHHLQMGSDTNDPLFLDHDGDDYLYLPRIGGNDARTAKKEWSISEDVDLRVKLQHDSWAPDAGTAQVPLAIDEASGRGIFIYLRPTGTLRLYWSEDGTNLIYQETTTPLASVLTPGSVAFLRVTLDVDNDAGGHTVKFYTSDDGEAWNQLDSDLVGAGITSIHNVSRSIYIGGRSDVWLGKIYSAQIRNGIDGPIVADFDASKSREPHRNFVDSVGNLWTINRSTSGRKAALVDRPMFLFGTDDYMQAPDHDDLDFGADQDFTVIAAYRRHDYSSSGFTYLAKKDSFGSAGVGWSLRTSTASSVLALNVSEGSASVGDTFDELMISGKTLTASGRRLDGLFELFINGETDGPGALVHNDLRNSNPLRVGRLSGAGTNYADMEFIGAAIFRRALTDSEIEEVSREFGWSPQSTILEEAIVAAVAGVYDAPGDRLVDITGHGHDFVFGGTDVPSTNDPLLLPYDGEKYVYVNESNANGVESSAVQQGTYKWRYEFDVVIRQPGGPSGYEGLLDHGWNSGPLVYVYHNGNVVFYYNSDGSNLVFSYPQFPFGERIRFAVEMEYDSGVWSGVLEEWDGNVWVEVASDSEAYAAPAFGATDYLKINRTGGSSQTGADIYSVRAIVDDVLVADFNPDRDASEPYATMVSSTTGETWTFNRTSSGRKLAVVDQNLLLFGTDDYAEALDHDELSFQASDGFTALVLMRRYGTPAIREDYFTLQSANLDTTGFWGLLKNGSGNTTGLHLRGDTRKGVGLSGFTSGELSWLAGVRDASTSMEALINGASSGTDTPPANIQNASFDLEIGGGGHSAATDYEVIGVALVRRALSESELQQLADELIAFNQDPTMRIVERPEPIRALPERVTP